MPCRCSSRFGGRRMTELGCMRQVCRISPFLPHLHCVFWTSELWPCLERCGYRCSTRIGSVLCQHGHPITTLGPWIISKKYIGQHFTSGELDDFLDCTDGLLLELDAMESLVQVDCVVACDCVEWLLLSLASLFTHLLLIFLILASCERGILSGLQQYNPPWKRSHTH